MSSLTAKGSRTSGVDPRPLPPERVHVHRARAGVAARHARIDRFFAILPIRDAIFSHRSRTIVPPTRDRDRPRRPWRLRREKALSDRDLWRGCRYRSCVRTRASARMRVCAHVAYACVCVRMRASKFSCANALTVISCATVRLERSPRDFGPCVISRFLEVNLSLSVHPIVNILCAVIDGEKVEIFREEPKCATSIFLPEEDLLSALLSARLRCHFLRFNDLCHKCDKIRATEISMKHRYACSARVCTR